MKNILGVLLILICQPLYAQNHDAHQQMMEAHLSSERQGLIEIAVLVYPDMVIQDAAGPLEVFSKAENLSGGNYRTFTVAQTSDVIATENGLLKIVADYTFDNAPEADYLIIPGASMPVINQHLADQTFSGFINDWVARDDVRAVSICTGAYLLAETGILRGRSATTHYFVADDFSELFPETKLVRDVRFVDEGDYIMSSGITSGIDAALHIVEKHSGEKTRAMIARAMQYEFQEADEWPVAPNGMRYRRN